MPDLSWAVKAIACMTQCTNRLCIDFVPAWLVYFLQVQNISKIQISKNADMILTKILGFGCYLHYLIVFHLVASWKYKSTVLPGFNLTTWFIIFHNSSWSFHRPYFLAKGTYFMNHIESRDGRQKTFGFHSRLCLLRGGGGSRQIC